MDGPLNVLRKLSNQQQKQDTDNFRRETKAWAPRNMLVCGSLAPLPAWTTTVYSTRIAVFKVTPEPGVEAHAWNPSTQVTSLKLARTTQ